MNLYPHRIHLKGPWDCEPLSATILDADGLRTDVPGPPPTCRQLTLPCRWADGGLGPFNGRVRFHRRFHWPSKLDYYERLWLCFSGVDYFTRVWLNDQELGAHEGAFGAFEFDVTASAQSRNDLVVEVDLPASADGAQRLFRAPPTCPAASGGLWGAVAVEVRREAFLRGVRAYANPGSPSGRLDVFGKVIGVADHPLELYVLIDGATVVYQRVEAAPGGRPFHFPVEVSPATRWKPEAPRLHELTVDLIDGASRLASVTMPFGLRRVSGAGTLTKIEGGETLMVEVEDERLEATCVDLNVPLSEADMFEHADREGRPLVLRLPLVGEFALDDSCQASLLRQSREVIAHLQHHPAIVGWLLHLDSPAENESLDRALFEGIAALDPTRPCWVSGK